MDIGGRLMFPDTVTGLSLDVQVGSRQALSTDSCT